MIKAQGRWLAFSPLLLLSLLPFAGRVALRISASAPNPEVAVLRYFVIPLIGLSLGAATFFMLLRWWKTGELAARCNLFLEKREGALVWGLTIAFLLLYLGLSLSSYLTLHLGLFDFGVYDAKIWHISAAPGLWGKAKIACTGHFQPILLFYSFFYNVGCSPAILLVLQGVAVLSGVIPLYLLCKKWALNPLITSGIALLYLLYPPVAFNSILDFHPDHFYIPLLLWAFFFAEEEKYAYVLPLLLLACAIKEPYILGVAFFGVYLIWKHKKYILGGAIAFFSIGLFYVVVFHLIPKTSFSEPGRTILQDPTFSYLGSSPSHIIRNLLFYPLSMLKEIFAPPKLRFPFFVLYPFFFLPILRPKEFLPAVPFLLIPLLSANLHHQNVASQYTAGIIPPVFMALIAILARVKRTFGRGASFSLLCGMGIMTLALNLAHSPLPISVNFWNETWSFGRYHYSNYLMSEHSKALEQAIDMVPPDPDLAVIIHSGIYQKKLFHRYRFGCFPQSLGKADYIILDNTRGYLFCDQRVSGRKYFGKVRELKRNQALDMIFDRDGILLFRRRGPQGKERG